MDDLLPVERLTALHDRFLCEPFAAVIPVRCCLARRGAAFDGGRMKGHQPKQHPAHPGCAKCPLGALVESRVPRKRATQPCAVCGAPVTGAKGRKPLCPKDRKGATHVR